MSGCAIAMLPDMARLCVPLDVECMPPTGALSSDASESFRSRRCSCLILASMILACIVSSAARSASRHAFIGASR